MNIHSKSDDKNKSKISDILTVYFVILFVWTLYRIFLRLPEWVDECIAKPLLWLGPLFLLQKKYILPLEKSWKITISQNIILGLFVGIIYFCSFTLFSSLRSSFPTFNPDHFSLQEIGLQFIIALSTGFVEELVFRRYILEEILLIVNDRIYANMISTILFALIHLPIIVFVYQYPLTTTVSYLSLLSLSGFIYGAVYLKNKSLTASTFTHAIWNFLGTLIK